MGRFLSLVGKVGRVIAYAGLKAATLKKGPIEVKTLDQQPSAVYSRKHAIP
jgi:hypothetical protein